MIQLLEAIGAVIVAGGALIGGSLGLVKFFYKRGGQEREWTTAIDENTASNKELASGLRDLKDFTVVRVHALEISHERLSSRVDLINEKMKGGN